MVLAHPGADTWTPVELSARFLRRIAGPTELVVLADCGHLPVEQPGLEQLRRVLGRVVEGTAGRECGDPRHG